MDCAISWVQIGGVNLPKKFAGGLDHLPTERVLKLKKRLMLINYTGKLTHHVFKGPKKKKNTLIGEDLDKIALDGLRRLGVRPC